MFFIFFNFMRSEIYVYIYIFIYIYIYIWCEAFSYIIKHRTSVFPRKRALEVFEFKNCDDCSVNIKFPQADQNLLQRRTCFYLHVGLVFLKLFGPHASFAHLFLHFVGFGCFCFLFFIMQICMWLSINLKTNNKTKMSKHMQIYEYSCSVFKRNCLMRSASHLPLRPVAECYTYIYIYIYIHELI